MKIEEDNQGFGNSHFYTSDFEDELEFVVDIEGFLGGIDITRDIHMPSLLEETFFNSLDIELECKDLESNPM